MNLHLHKGLNVQDIPKKTKESTYLNPITFSTLQALFGNSSLTLFSLRHDTKFFSNQLHSLLPYEGHLLHIIEWGTIFDFHLDILILYSVVIKLT